MKQMCPPDKLVPLNNFVSSPNLRKDLIKSMSVTD